MVDGAHGQNGPNVRECVEKKERPDSGSVTTQHRLTEDKTVMAKEFERRHVTTKNVQVNIYYAAKGWKRKKATVLLKRVVKGIFVTRDQLFFYREM